MRKIYQVYGQDAHEMTLKLLEAADAIRLVPAGGNVALKPNLVVAGTPEEGATTHAGVLMRLHRILPQPWRRRHKRHRRQLGRRRDHARHAAGRL